MKTTDELFTPKARPLPPDELIGVLKGEPFLDYLAQHIYGVDDREWLKAQQKRYIDTVAHHRLEYGDAPVRLLRAPGRLNLFMEYLDICRGDHMSTTIDGDIPMVMGEAAGGSDRVRVRNIDKVFARAEFSISAEIKRFRGAADGAPPAGCMLFPSSSF